jgi:DNA-binding beta-propeller fold protein YncE
MRVFSLALLFLVFSVFRIFAQTKMPATRSEGDRLRLVETITLPAAVKGSFDHFGIDLKRNRLFATAEDFKAVLVFDLAKGALIDQIDGIVRPHAVLYRADTDRLYVTDGGDGSLKVYDGESYRLIDRIALLKDADSIGYDLSRKYLYIDNGGGDAGQTYSMISVVDTNAGKKVSDIKVDGDTLEAMALDNYRPRLYVNDRAKNTVVVIDRLKNTIMATWPITMGKGNVAIALDEQRQRLFVACRDGNIVVLDSNTGRELQALPIAKSVDETIYDPKSGRLYAFGGGSINIFDQAGRDQYISRGSVNAGSKAKTARLVPELNRLFVAAPQEGNRRARILIYEPTNMNSRAVPSAEAQTPVNAPVAEGLVLDTLSAHPFLRRMGLHVIPPGQENMILIANGNAMRLGIRTSAGDFAATKDGKTYGPLNADGGFYNMKMQMFDAQGRRIGILVMEIPATAANSEEDAAHQAEAIRAELAQRIPSLEWLFQDQ